MRSPLEIASQLADGLNAWQLALLLELTLTMSAGMSARNPVESPEDRTALERRRALDRVRKQAKRAAVSAGMSADTSADKQKFPVTLREEEVGLHQEVIEKKKDKTTKKGSRLLKGATLSEAGRSFAVSAGMSADKVDAEWDEFVDYWIGVPGSRGCKADWPATWRNRVRDRVSKFYSRNRNGNGFSNARGDASAGRATARETDFLTAMGKGALNVLGKGISAGPDGEVPRDPDTPRRSAA